MRRLPLFLALIVPIAIVGVQPSAAAKRTCSVKGSKTVVKSKFARVYTVNSSRGDEIQRLYGCVIRTGKRFRLDTSSDDGLATSTSFSQVKLAGRYVAWEHVDNDYSCRAACPPDYDGTSETIALADLKARTRKGYAGNARDGSLTVNARGTVAWIDEATGEPRSQSLR
jgi:hypothetical protein